MSQDDLRNAAQIHRPQLLARLHLLSSTRPPNKPIDGFAPPTSSEISDIIKSINESKDDDIILISHRIISAFSRPDLNEDRTSDQLELYVRIDELLRAASEAIESIKAAYGVKEVINDINAQNIEKISRDLSILDSKIDSIKEKIESAETDIDSQISFSVPGSPISVSLRGMKLIVSSVKESISLGVPLAVDSVVQSAKTLTDAAAELTSNLSTIVEDGVATILDAILDIVERTKYIAAGLIEVIKSSSYGGSFEYKPYGMIGTPNRSIRRAARAVNADIAVDLGTNRTRIYAKGQGVVLDEPSLIAFRQVNGKMKVHAVGSDADQFIDRAPAHITVVRPVRDGVVTQAATAEEMMKYFVRRAFGGRPLFFNPGVIVCVPTGATDVERQAVNQVFRSVGARRTGLIDSPMAAAIGAGLPVHEPRASLVADIGGGVTDVAVVSLSGIVYSRSIKIGGNAMSNAIIEYLRKYYNLLVSEHAAERVKRTIGSAISPVGDGLTMNVRGRDLMMGVARDATVPECDIVDALSESVNAIIAAIRVALEATPAELASDISERGVVLTGGGSQLRDIDRAIADHLGVAVRVADNPDLCGVMGSGKVLEHPRWMKGILG